MASVMPDVTAAPTQPWRDVSSSPALEPEGAEGPSFEALLTGGAGAVEPTERPNAITTSPAVDGQAVTPPTVQPAIQVIASPPATLLGLVLAGVGPETANVGTSDQGGFSIAGTAAEDQGGPEDAANPSSEEPHAAPIQPQIVIPALAVTALVVGTDAMADAADGVPISVPPETLGKPRPSAISEESLSSIRSKSDQGIAVPKRIGEAITSGSAGGVLDADSGQAIVAPEWIGEAITSDPTIGGALDPDTGQSNADTQSGPAVRTNPTSREPANTVLDAIATPAAAPPSVQAAGPTSVNPASDRNVAAPAARASSDRSPPATIDPKLVDLSVSQSPARADAQAPGFPLTFAHSLAQSAAGSSITLPASADAAAVPLTGVAVEIASRAFNGDRRFEIRLDPPELGRIDVRLDMSRDGSVSSRLVVERAETLDLLRRDAGNLERALQSAGLNTSGSGLEFSLRDGSSHPRAALENFTTADLLIVPDDDVAVTEAVRRAYGVLRGLGRGLDIQV